MSEVTGDDRPFDGQRHDDERDGMILHEQRLQPGVERVETGRVEVRKRIVVEEVTVTLPVRREVVDLVRVYDDGSEEVLDLPPSYWEPRVEDRTGAMPYGEDSADERRAAERAASDDEVYDGQRDDQRGADNALGEVSESYDVVLHEERPVIATEIYAVERLRLGISRETSTVTYTDTVAREAADFDLDGDTYPDVTH